MPSFVLQTRYEPKHNYSYSIVDMIFGL